MKPKVQIHASNKGLGDDAMARALYLIFNKFNWIVPTRFSESEEGYQPTGDDPVSDCMSLYAGKGTHLDVKGKGGDVMFGSSDRHEPDSTGVLTYWANSSKAFAKKDPEQIEVEILEVAKALHSPHAAAYDDNIQQARNVYWNDNRRHVRSHGYEFGLFVPRWRELIGPRMSAAMIDGLRRLEGGYSKDMGDGYWFLRPYDSPEDGLTEEGRAREEEIIDVLGRRFFYDFETESEAYFRPGGDTIWSGSIFDGNWP